MTDLIIVLFLAFTFVTVIYYMKIIEAKINVIINLIDKQLDKAASTNLTVNEKIKKLDASFDWDKWNDWEREFISSINSRVSIGKTITPPQAKTIDKLYSILVINGGEA